MIELRKLGFGLLLPVMATAYGCVNLAGLLSPKPEGPGIAAKATPGPSASVTPTPSGTAAPPPTTPATTPPGAVPTAQPDPLRFDILSNDQLGYLVSNNAAGLRGFVTGPSSLISNNAAGLVSNNAAGLVSNNNAGLVSNNAAGYRVAASTQGVAAGFVYLTTPDEQFHVTQDRRLYSAVTDSSGKFQLQAPAADSLVINVLLSGNRRLTALANTRAGGTIDTDVTLATTLVTELVRYKAREFGFKIEDALLIPEARTALDRLNELTRDLVANEAVLASLKPSDLSLGNVPVLRQRYVVAFGTSANRELSDAWVTFLRAVNKDPNGSDLKYRPLAVTTIEAGVQVGEFTLGVAVDPTSGAIYVAHQSSNTSTITEIPTTGSPKVLVVKNSAGDDGIGYPANLAMAPNGHVVIPDATNQWVAIMDPKTVLLHPLLDFNVFGVWTNPKLLLDCVTGGREDFEPDDVSFGDGPNAKMYITDLQENLIWSLADPLGTDDPTARVAQIVAGSPRLMPDLGDVIPKPLLADVRFNHPSNVTFHKHASKEYLYVADGGDHLVVALNLTDGTARRIAGAIPTEFDGAVRKHLEFDAKAEEGGNPLEAHLNYPHKMLFDSPVSGTRNPRMFFADSDNRVIRVVSPYDTGSKIYAIAGRQSKAGENPPPFTNEDGDARNVSLGETQGMAMDKDGNLILTDIRSHRVRKVWTSFLK